MKWFAKVERVIANEVELVHYAECADLRTLYNGCLTACKLEDCAAAHIFRGPLRKAAEPEAEYILCKGSLGGVLLASKKSGWGKDSRLINIRENNLEVTK